MYCVNCGNKMLEEDKFCINCGKANVFNNNQNSQSSINQNMNIQNNQVNQINSSIQNSQNNQDSNKISPEDKKKANTLCILSLLLTYGSGIIIYLMQLLTSNSYNNYSPLNDNLFESVYLVCALAGIVLMIVARVKYPKSLFAKILMWIYIIELIVTAASYVLMIVFVYLMCLGLGGNF